VSSVATAITAAATTAPITKVLAAMPPTAAPPAAPAPAAPPAPAVAGAGAGAACANTDCEAIIKTEATKAEVILDFMDTLSRFLIDPRANLTQQCLFTIKIKTQASFLQFEKKHVV
jgi:hypothetical protein